MATTLNPYLNFDGNAHEAMTFYRDALGGEMDVNTFGEFGDDGPHKDKVMHCRLTTRAGFTLMASDTPPGTDYSPGQNISISISGSDPAELRGYWDRLSDGANVTMPLEKQIWGDEYGSLVDRFGIAWMVNITGDAQGAPPE